MFGQASIFDSTSLWKSGVVDQVARPGEVVAVLVKRHGHDAVGRVERLLDAITVMNVNVDVHYAGVPSEQLENAQHAVVHVAKPRRLLLFGMVSIAVGAQVRFESN